LQKIGDSYIIDVLLEEVISLMSKYRRLTKGLNSIGKLIPANADPYEYITDTSKDWYLSIYQYDEDQKKQAEESIGS
jgi:hypothetical protein